MPDMPEVKLFAMYSRKGDSPMHGWVVNVPRMPPLYFLNEHVAKDTSIEVNKKFNAAVARLLAGERRKALEEAIQVVEGHILFVQDKRKIVEKIRNLIGKDEKGC